MSDIEETENPKDRKFVEALSRGLDVLRALQSRHEPVDNHGHIF